DDPSGIRRTEDGGRALDPPVLGSPQGRLVAADALAPNEARAALRPRIGDDGREGHSKRLARNEAESRRQVGGLDNELPRLRRRLRAAANGTLALPAACEERERGDGRT